MKTTQKRAIICVKDVMLISGKSERHSCRILFLIRKKYDKPPMSFVSVDEFCNYMGLSKELVEAYLQ